jgi:hypothetical protein
VIGRLFLAINGKTLALNEVDVINFKLAVAAGNMTELQTADWIRLHLVTAIDKAQNIQNWMKKSPNMDVSFFKKGRKMNF